MAKQEPKEQVKQVMTSAQAIELLDRAVQQMRLTREEHGLLSTALRVLSERRQK